MMIKYVVCKKTGWTFPKEDKGRHALYMVATELLESLLLRCAGCGLFVHDKCADTVQEEVSGQAGNRCCPFAGHHYYPHEEGE